jgi:hypothetical protein
MRDFQSDKGLESANNGHWDFPEKLAKAYSLLLNNSHCVCNLLAELKNPIARTTSPNGLLFV